MNRFFAEKIISHQAVLSSEDAHHLRDVRRAKLGDRFEICDGCGKEYIAKLTALNKQEAVLELEEEVAVDRECQHNFVLCQGVPKGRKLEDVVRHATELGMREFYPVITERTQLPRGDVDKSERLQRIADEAAKQSKRQKLPVIHNPVTLSWLLQTAEPEALKIVAWEEETQNTLQNILQGNCSAKVYLFVGPEGGLSAEEVLQMKEQGWISVTLGKRILRTETAPLALLSAVSFALGEWI